MTAYVTAALCLLVGVLLLGASAVICRHHDKVTLSAVSMWSLAGGFLLTGGAWSAAIAATVLS